jgi:hypothetical protein
MEKHTLGRFVEHRAHHTVSAPRYRAAAVDLARLVLGRCQSKHRPDCLGFTEASRHVDTATVLVPRNLSIDWRRPRTSPRSTAAGTSATIDAAPARQSRHHRSPIARAPSSPRILDQQFSLKRNSRSAAQAARPDRAGQFGPLLTSINFPLASSEPRYALQFFMRRMRRYSAPF